MGGEGDPACKSVQKHVIWSMFDDILVQSVQRNANPLRLMPTSPKDVFK